MFFKILFALAVVLEFVFVPLFLKYSWPDKCKKSLMYKMICSTLFVLAGLLAMKITGNNTSYAKLIIWGLVFGWLGDLFLHLLTDKIWVFGIGLVSFLVGHIFYIAAFQKAIYVSYPQAHTVAWYEVLLVLALVGLIVFYAVKKKIDIKNIMAVPVLLYALTISCMLVKALRFYVGAWFYGGSDHLFALFVTVAVGAIFFVLSDGSLGMILYGGESKNRPLKIFNIATYFAAQILLASSIFFVFTPALQVG